MKRYRWEICIRKGRETLISIEKSSIRTPKGTRYLRRVKVAIQRIFISISDVGGTAREAKAQQKIFTGQGFVYPFQPSYTRRSYIAGPIETQDSFSSIGCRIYGVLYLLSRCLTEQYRKLNS
uniref:Uncharacterized protein n=1 Tax=Picea glauca TaxID=3330 RepID=A0A101LX51_PICGL|nr:hypothetical protein ABT39_MTgene5983 [Picea glauca]